MFDVDGTGAAPAGPSESNFTFDILDEEPSAAPESSPPAPGSPAQPGTTPSAQPPSPPSQPPEGAPPQPAPGSAAAPGTPAEPTPFTFRADGAEHGFANTAVNPDGSVTFQPDALEDLRALLAEGVTHRGSWREQQSQLQEYVAQREQEADAKLASAAAVVQKATNMLAALDQLRRQGPEKVAEWLDDLDRNWDKMQLKAENDLLRQQYQAQQGQLTGYQVEQQAAALEPQLETTLRSTLQDLAAQYPGVDLDLAFDRLAGTRLDDVFFEADAATARKFGVAEGTVMVNYGAIEDEVSYQASLLQQAGAAARANAAAAAPIPPTVGAAGTPSPSGTSAEPGKRFKTKQELDDYFESGKVYEELHRS